MEVNDKVLVTDKRGIVTGIAHVLEYPYKEEDGTLNTDFVKLSCNGNEFKMHISRTVAGNEATEYLHSELRRWLNKLLPATHYLKHLDGTLRYYKDAEKEGILTTKPELVSMVEKILGKFTV